MNLFGTLYENELQKTGFRPCSPKHREGRHFSLNSDMGEGSFWEYDQEDFFLISEMELLLENDLSISFSHNADMHIIGQFESNTGVSFSDKTSVNPKDIKAQLPGQTKCGISYERKRRIHGMSIVLLPSFLAELQSKYPHDIHPSFSVDTYRNVPTRIFADIKSFRGTGLSAKLYYESKVLEMLSYLYKYEAEKPTLIGEDDLIRIKETMAFIDTNISLAHRVDTLSERACMSTTKFKTSFNAVAKIPVSEYITNSRLQTARVILTENNLTISEVASMVGYKKAGAFSSAYRAYYGELPSETKIKYRNS